jgi:hypothetical protein
MRYYRSNGELGWGCLIFILLMAALMSLFYLASWIHQKVWELEVKDPEQHLLCC